MPPKERQERHARMMEAIRANDVVAWRCPLAALEAGAPERAGRAVAA